MQRTSIYTAGFGHENPIPVASRIGPMLYSGALTGRDPSDDTMPADLAAQCEHVFAQVRLLMAAAGGSLEDIVKMTFHLVDYRDRAALNDQWLRHFPDPASRPARQVVAAALDRGARIHCDIVAVLEW